MQRHRAIGASYLTETRVASARAKCVVFEDVISKIDTYKHPCIKHDRRRREPGARNPCGRKWQERDHEEMHEVDPYQSRCRRAYELHKVIVVDPNDGDEQIPPTA